MGGAWQNVVISGKKDTSGNHITETQRIAETDQGLFDCFFGLFFG
jgi:hypothetical protein